MNEMARILERWARISIKEEEIDWVELRHCRRHPSTTYNCDISRGRVNIQFQEPNTANNKLLSLIHI